MGGPEKNIGTFPHGELNVIVIKIMATAINSQLFIHQAVPTGEWVLFQLP